MLEWDLSKEDFLQGTRKPTKMSDHFSCGKGTYRPNQGGCENNNVPMPTQYCQEFSRPPWTRPEDDRARYNEYEQNQQRFNEMKAYQDNEYGRQYISKHNAPQQANDERSNMPDPCRPEQGVSQYKSKPKYKKRPIKPFATTDQLRNKIFGYIENQPNLAPLRPFRGYRDDIVRQQLCCSDDLVTNPPDPCPPEDSCDEWKAEEKGSACTCPPPEPSCPCPSNSTSGRSTASRGERNPCSKGKPAKKCKKAEPAKNCESDELADILEYCKQIKGETTGMYYYNNAVNEAAWDDAYGEVGAFNAPSTPSSANKQGPSGEYEPDPELRCEEEIADDEDDHEQYKDHPMFGGPDSVPKRTLNDEMKMYKLHVANIRKRYFGEMMKNIDDLDTITPDIAAAMVYSEELGMKIKSAPQTAYDYLYPDAPSQPMLNIGYVTESAPKGIDDIVVPLAPPMMLTAAEFPGLEDPAMLDHPRILQVMPSMNLVEEPKATDTMPPNDICELVTGTTHVNMMSLLYPEYEGMENIEEDEDEDDQRFNIKLNPSIPAHFTQIQIRGSEPPSWFPGYYVALPSKPDVCIERKYGSILEKVWEEVQPEFVRPSGGAAIIGS